MRKLLPLLLAGCPFRDDVRIDFDTALDRDVEVDSPADPEDLLPAACPPALAYDVAACLASWWDSGRHDGDLGELAATCAAEHELRDALDAWCDGAEPRPAACDGALSWDRLSSACATAGLRAHGLQTCVLGAGWDDLHDHPRVLVTGERSIVRGTPLDDVERAQVAALGAVLPGEPVGVDAVIDAAGGYLRAVDVVDRFGGGTFTLWADDGRGLAFPTDATAAVAELDRGLFVRCDAPPGRAGAACDPDDPACDGLACAGVGPDDLGVCEDVAPWPGEGEACGDDGETCAVGLVCARRSAPVASRRCVPGWMTGAFSDVSYAPVPAGGELVRSFAVSGLGDVVTDVEVALRLAHPSTAHLRVTVESPAGTVGSVFDGGSFDDAVTLDRPVPGWAVDEPANGTWRLHVRDDGDGHGVLVDATLRLTSWRAEAAEP